MDLRCTSIGPARVTTSAHAPRRGREAADRGAEVLTPRCSGRTARRRPPLTATVRPLARGEANGLWLLALRRRSYLARRS
jgi:hypothetical protein